MKKVFALLALTALTPHAFASEEPLRCEYASWENSIVNIDGFGTSEFDSRNALYKNCMARFQR